MLIFVDESGCAGFQLAHGSSEVFIVGMAIFQNNEDAAHTHAAIEMLHAKLRHKPEFRFSKCSDAVRDAFCRGVASCPFKIQALVVRKERVYDSLLRERADQFYSYCLQMLLKHNESLLRAARIKIDGRGERAFRRALNRQLRQDLGAARIRDIVFGDSKSDRLLQLADMCVGAIARSHSKRDKSDRWLQMLAARIENVWEVE